MDWLHWLLLIALGMAVLAALGLGFLSHQFFKALDGLMEGFKR